RGAATAIAKFERLRGTVGALREGGVSVAADPVWGSVTVACAPRVCGTLSLRAEPSRQGECPALSSVKGRRKVYRPHSWSRTARRAPEILRGWSRVRFLSKRDLLQRGALPSPVPPT